MNIGLIDVDSHNFPNLALMKISAYHKHKGDTVEFYDNLNAEIEEYDIVYVAKVFTIEYTPDYIYPIKAKKVIKGGTGYDIKNKLPEYIEDHYPDYDLYHDIYPKFRDTAIGFLTRGCPRNCDFCLVTQKEGFTNFKNDLKQFWNGQKHIKLLDPNILGLPDKKKVINLLTELSESKVEVDFTQGLDIRILTKEQAEIINNIKLKVIHFAWDSITNLEEMTELLKEKREWLKFNRRKLSLYVLTNFDSTHEQDLYRVNKLREMEFYPYVMIYNKSKAPKITKKMQRWVNNRFLWESIDTFQDYLNGKQNESQLSLFT